MAVQILESDFPNDRLPLLRWLMFTGVCAFGFVLLWYYGLFRLMLAPVAGLDAADRASVKNSMGLMSDGMAVAMYTTLTGLVGSILVQTQYYLLDEATAKLFGLATDLTEVFVVSVLEREQDGQLR